MFKSMTAMAALAGLMMFGAGSQAQAMGGYACAPGYNCATPCARVCMTPCATVACRPACTRTYCTNYTSFYRDCEPRYVAGDCLPCYRCRPSCGLFGW